MQLGELPYFTSRGEIFSMQFFTSGMGGRIFASPSRGVLSRRVFPKLEVSKNTFSFILGGLGPFNFQIESS